MFIFQVVRGVIVPYRGSKCAIDDKCSTMGPEHNCFKVFSKDLKIIVCMYIEQNEMNTLSQIWSVEVL